MNILSKILLAGYDIKLEASSWADIVDIKNIEDKDMFIFKLVIAKRSNENVTLGVISDETLKKDHGEQMILNTLEDMFTIAEKKN